MKIRTWFKLGAVLLFCAAAAFLLLRFNPFAWELPGLSLFSTEKIFRPRHASAGNPGSIPSEYCRTGA